MQSFEWVDATSVEHAAGLLAGRGTKQPVIAKAGGVDLMDLMKEGILAPARIVNLKSIPGLDRYRARPSGEMEIGALTTLARIADAPELRKRYRAFADAAAHAATPQVRNAATIGGNLLQKPRCWYLRNQHFHQAGMPDDPAREGENQYHAIFDNDATSLMHASTPATALVAFDAKVILAGPEGRSRTVPLREFFLPPTLTGERDTVIEPGEVLTQVVLPALPEGTRSAYHKQTERDSYDWPICDVAVVLTLEKTEMRKAAIVMGWVAPTPRRASESEAILAGRRLNEETAREAARAAVAGASPLSKNSYKVPILEAVVRRTILAAASA